MKWNITSGVLTSYRDLNGNTPHKSRNNFSIVSLEMEQRCIYCGKLVEIGEALVPYDVVCDDCAKEHNYSNFPADWESSNVESVEQSGA